MVNTVNTVNIVQHYSTGQANIYNPRDKATRDEPRRFG
jgi:hypothetical protein